jgi:hypothetical protein
MKTRAGLLILTAVCLVAANSFAQESPPKGLVIAAKAMDQYLQTLDQGAQARWKQQFAWDQWGPQLRSEVMPERDQLEKALPKFYGLLDGLDQAEFLRMRMELKSYLQGTDPPTPVGVFPSLLIRMDKKLIDARLEKQSRTLNYERPTGNEIAGAWVTGLAHSHVEVNAKLVDFQDQAAIEVRLTGAVRSPHTIASARRFEVHGAATTQTQGVAHLFLDDGKFRSTSPQVSAQTHSQLHYVDGPRPFRRIAMRQAQKRQPQGEAEGAEIVRSTVHQEFQQQLAQETQQINEKLADYEKLWSVLKRVDIAPTQVKTALQGNTLELGLRFTDSGADQARSAAALAEGESLELAMHDTFLSAYPRRFLKGVWWTEKDFEQLRKEIVGVPLDSSPEEASLEKWSARWDPREPFAISVTPEYVECILTFSQVGVSDQWIKEGIVARAKFRPVTNGAQIALGRLGEVEVKPRSPNIELTPEELEFYRRQFSKLCDEAIPLDHLNPFAGVGASALSLFTKTNVSLDSAWLSIKYKKSEGALTKALGQIKEQLPAQRDEKEEMRR